MVLYRSLRAVTVTLCNGNDDGLMFAQSFFSTALNGEGRTGQQGHGSVNQLQLADQEPIVRGPVDLRVKSAVGPGQCAGIAQKRLIFGHHGGEDADLFPRGVGGGKACCKTLKLSAHNIKLCQFRVIEGGNNERAPVPRQKPLCLEPLQGLSNRCPGHIEPRGQLAFDKPVTGRIGSKVNGLQNEGVCIPHRGLCLGHERAPSDIRTEPTAPAPPMTTTLETRAVPP